MPEIVETDKQKEWKLANALSKFLPQNLEWRPIGGYPILYRKGFWGSFKGIAFLSGDKKRITIESRRWKDAILKAKSEYEAANGVTVDVKLDF